MSIPPPSPVQHTTPLPSPTLTHLLALPPLLHPISQPLAALHLARLRLSLSIPISPLTFGIASGKWCSTCGHLAPPRIKKRQGKSIRDRASRDHPFDSMSRSQHAESYAHLGMEGALDHQIAQSSSGGNRKEKAKCELCGELLGRPKKDLSVMRDYPPARRTRRQISAHPDKGVGAAAPTINPVTTAGDAGRIAPRTALLTATVAAAVANELMARINSESTALSVPIGSSDIYSEASNDISKTVLGLTTNPIPSTIPNETVSDIGSPTARNTTSYSTGTFVPSPLPTEPKDGDLSVMPVIPTVRPHPLQRPSLSYIPKSSPNPPTYPRPPDRIVSPSPSVVENAANGSGSSGNGKRSASPNFVPGGGKKKKNKMSGLSKLLAESKAREQVGSGNWGLG